VGDVTEDRTIQLRRAIYRFFADHARAPLPEDVGATPADFRRLERAHAVVLDDGGRIVFSNPFAAGPTDFAVRSGSMRWSAICAWDSLGILAATGRDGEVRTTCPDCAEGIELGIAARWYEDLGHT
jgi:Alkylmercury lyase